MKRRLAFVSALLAASPISSALAYRTVADLPDFDGTERVRWANDEVRFEISDWLPPGLDPLEVEQAVEAGFSVWSRLDCPTVSMIDDGFVSTSAAPGDGRVTVQFVGHDWVTLGFDAAAAASTEVVYERTSGGVWRIVDADIYVNAELFGWSTDGLEASGRDVQAVLAHEVGHVLGLLHPCELDGRDGAPVCGPAHDGLTMHPEYLGLEQRSLEEDDRDGACFLYEPAACAATGCPAGMACTFEGCVVECDGALCGVGERCGPVGCTAEPCAPGSCERGCEQTCEGSGGANGDPCDADAQCWTGLCTSAGYCAPGCVDGFRCPDGYVCDQAASPPECLAMERVLGDSCTSAAECLSGLCLVEDGRPSLCTRRCGGTELDCPVGFSCEPVDGMEVCVTPFDGGACAVAASGRVRTWPVFLLLLVLAVVFRRGRR